MSRHRPRPLLIGLALAVVLLVIGAVGVTRGTDPTTDITTRADGSIVTPAAFSGAGPATAADLDELVEQLQNRLEAVPGDHVAWSTLGLAYVQKARIDADPSLYERADGALARSLAVEPDDNFLAHAGLSALASARHDFVAAKRHAETGLEINDFNATLWGALSDAQVQLGNYDAADSAVGRMLALSPDTASFSRASYLAELRGDIDLATSYMEQAHAAAPTSDDRAFALTILGDLRFRVGEPGPALTLYNQALAEAPDNAPALFGKARSEAATGQIRTSLDHYAELVEIAPEPGYLVEYGELLEAQGRTAEANEQYDLVETVQGLYEANGVEPDAAPVLFLAEHGSPERALAAAEEGVRSRPFLAMHDAHAWALFMNGRHGEALVAIEKALALGTPDASFLYHSGRIKLALGDDQGAGRDLSAALDLNPHFDVLDAPIARQLLDDLGGSAT